MATIQFHLKPGCATNARQKRMLEAAGHIVVAKACSRSHSMYGFRHAGNTPFQT
jgi:hypothetical protein